MKEKRKKTKPKHFTWNNTVYLIKNLWTWDKILFLICGVQIVVTVVIPLLEIYLPKILLDSMPSNVNFLQLLKNIGYLLISWYR
ncbi:hypothetical protein [Tepidimicrobium xylanilyticum]|uniref:hypothetical protein n=1 Tax=Tepidimicrobium xylanilyticum TaxID=1123352 RepID=UPI000B88A50A|nr:hypothetical protein [Tepidimicrobium xylanilyticum]